MSSAARVIKNAIESLPFSEQAHWRKAFNQYLLSGGASADGELSIREHREWIRFLKDETGDVDKTIDDLLDASLAEGKEGSENESSIVYLYNHFHMDMKKMRTITALVDALIEVNKQFSDSRNVLDLTGKLIEKSNGWKGKGLGILDPNIPPYPHPTPRSPCS